MDGAGCCRREGEVKTEEYFHNKNRGCCCSCCSGHMVRGLPAFAYPLAHLPARLLVRLLTYPLALPTYPLAFSFSYLPACLLARLPTYPLDCLPELYPWAGPWCQEVFV
uniref:CENP-V/GFA domain-containing protein n=1 Tax=Setaria digitata TaxID=48799 RepID=A0A915Q5V9_9BILA